MGEAPDSTPEAPPRPVEEWDEMPVLLSPTLDKRKGLWYAYSIKRGATEPRRKGRRGMAGTITAKKTIRCANCGCGLRRTKQIKITATTQEEFTIEVQAKVAAWEKSLEGQNCAICQDAFDLFQRKGKYAQQ
jgi:hypothetical protein